MSTLKVNTVSHSTSGFSNVVQFTDGAGTQNASLCRGWVRFNGEGTQTISGSFNVGTIDDGGTGYFRINWDTAFPNANYCTVVCGTGAQTSNGYVQHDSQDFGGEGTNAPLAGSITIRCVNGSGNRDDHPWITAAAFN